MVIRHSMISVRFLALKIGDGRFGVFDFYMRNIERVFNTKFIKDDVSVLYSPP